MAVVQPVPDDEIDAELAAGWGADPDELPARLTAAVAAPVPQRNGPIERRRPTDPADILEAAARVRPVSLAGEHVLSLSTAFADVLPAGLRRGTTVTVAGTRHGAGPAPRAGDGATTLALALVADASADGAWVAAVGLPALGLAAVVDARLALERFVVLADPPPEQWTTVVGALVGSFDVVLVAPPGRLRPSQVRRVAARARERGSVLVQLDGAARPVDGAPAATGPDAGLDADVRLLVRTVAWSGLGDGHGRLEARRVVVETAGRRSAARLRRAELWLPDPEGRVRVVTAEERGDAVDHGTDIDAARRARIRRIAERPLDLAAASALLATEAPPTRPRPGRARTAWSDAG